MTAPATPAAPFVVDDAPERPADATISPARPATPAATAGTITEPSIRAHLEFLASDALNGRGSGTRDEWLAASRTWRRSSGSGDSSRWATPAPTFQASKWGQAQAPRRRRFMSVGAMKLTHGREMLVATLGSARRSHRVACGSIKLGVPVPDGAVVLLPQGERPAVAGAACLLALETPEQRAQWSDARRSDADDPAPGRQNHRGTLPAHLIDLCRRGNVRRAERAARGRHRVARRGDPKGNRDRLDLERGRAPDRERSGAREGRRRSQRAPRSRRRAAAGSGDPHDLQRRGRRCVGDGGGDDAGRSARERPAAEADDRLRALRQRGARRLRRRYFVDLPVVPLNQISRTCSSRCSGVRTRWCRRARCG